MSRFATLSTLALAVVLLAPAAGAQTKLTASNAANADFLGAHVAVSDDGLRAVAAAPLSEGGGTVTDVGALYVYSRSDDNSAWTQQAVLTASDAAQFDNLGTWTNANPLNGGSPLAMSGDGTRIAAGALLADISGNTDQGAVYVFALDNGTWAQEAKLTGAATLFTQFGFSIDLDGDGDRMIVGTRFDDLGSGDTNEGRAYVFDRDGGTWTETARLTAETPAAADFFGAAVGISDDGETAIVGAPLDDSAAITDNANNDAGAVYVFTRGGDGSWSQQARLEASAPVAADNLGYAADISGMGGRIAAGAFLRDVSGNADAGAVYVFTDDGGAWTQEAVLTGSGTTNSMFANLGIQVSINDDGRRVLAGAPLDDFAADENQGRAYAFTRSDDGTWSETSMLSETGGAPADFFGSSVALSGDGETAVVGAVFDDNPSVTDTPDNNQGAAFVFALNALPTTVVSGPEGAVSISAVYPNPLRRAGQIEVTLAETRPVSAVLYNTLGQRVADVFEGVLAGGQTQTLSVSTDGLAPGVYVLRLQAGGTVATQRLVVVR